ncbi:MAG TPA: O-antigen ligase family protein [Actinomycetota bacterium]
MATRTEIDRSVGEGGNATPKLRGAVLDVAGVALFAALVGWTILAGTVSGDDPALVSGLVAVSGMGVLVGRVAGIRSGFIIPAALGAAALVLIVRSPDDLVGSGPLGGPFGYANATGAFLAQAAIAGVIIGVSGRWVALRVVGWAAAIGFGTVVFGSGSMAAFALVVALPLVALAVSRWLSPRVAVGLMAGLFATALAATIVVGATYPSDGSAEPGIIERTVGERRAVLWRDAVDIMAEEPLTGAGIGSFQRLSPTAVDDADARWAHNEFLEVGAETGFPGLILLVLAFAWVFARLWMGPPDSVAALGAAAAAAIGIHASIDYVLHFPAIPIAAAALIGSTTAWNRRSGGR